MPATASLPPRATGRTQGSAAFAVRRSADAPRRDDLLAGYLQQVRAVDPLTPDVEGVPGWPGAQDQHQQGRPRHVRCVGVDPSARRRG